MIGAAYEKENFGSSWGRIRRTQPDLATACGTFIGSGYHIDTIVGDPDRLNRFA